jgi:hypothetical protein
MKTPSLGRLISQFLAHHSKNHSHIESHLNSEVNPLDETPSSQSSTSVLDELSVHEQKLWIPLFGCLFFFIAVFLLGLRFGCMSKSSKRSHVFLDATIRLILYFYHFYYEAAPTLMLHFVSFTPHKTYLLI